MRPADRLRIAAQRLAAMRIAPVAVREEGPDGTPEPVAHTIARTVAHHLAMQAQDAAGGLWSVGVRTGATRAQVEAAAQARLITRSWPMRGTLHLMATQDVRWMCRLLAAEMTAAERSRHAQLELTPATLDRAREVLVAALRGGVAVPRPQVLETLRQRDRPVRPTRGPHPRTALPGGAALPGAGRGAAADLRPARGLGALVLGSRPRGGDGGPRRPLRGQPRPGDHP